MKYYLLVVLLTIPSLLLAQKIDSAALKSRKLYYWGGLNVGVGYGAVGSSEGTGLSYGLSATALLNHNFLKVKAAANQSFDQALAIIGSSAGSNYKNYDLLLGRQFPLSAQTSVCFASGIAHLKYHSNLTRDQIGGQPLEYTNNGIPLEITLMHSNTKMLGGSLSFEFIFTNKQTMGNVTFGVILGKVREKMKRDEKI